MARRIDHDQNVRYILGTLACVGIILSIFTLLLGVSVFFSIINYTSSPECSATFPTIDQLSISCDDENDCTADYLVDSLCVHYDTVNNLSCTDQCLKNTSVCKGGKCSGECKGECSVNETCPHLTFVDLTNYSNFLSDNGNDFRISRGCLHTFCIYDMYVSFDTSGDGPLADALKTLWVLTEYYDGGLGMENWTYVDNRTEAWLFNQTYTLTESTICMAFISDSEPDRECLIPHLLKLYTSNYYLNIHCRYAYECATVSALSQKSITQLMQT